ncbi:MAG: CoA pyrophosphatase [Thermoleophilaceae bacterium]|nr:CoA pyrophosphatase [Thermoleophilaceae bacterium]
MEIRDKLRSVLLTSEDAARVDAPGRRDAAVLVPLFVAGGDLHAVFTKRREDLAHHAGEISFPGGGRDSPDEDLRMTALRETEEEIGLPRDAVEILGALPATPTFVSDYRILPFVGLIEAGHAWRLQPTEVDEVLELSIPDLIRGYEHKRVKQIPFRTTTYTVRGALVWGATARIVASLLERIEPLAGA